MDQPGTPIGARVTHFFASGTPQGGAIIVSSATPLLVDSQVRADEATRQGACFKGK